MTFEELKSLIDRMQGEAGNATGGCVDRLVYSGLDVHTMLSEIDNAVDDLQEIYAPKIQIPKWVADVLDKMIVDGFTFYDFELDLLFDYTDANNKEDLIDWLRIDNAINVIEKVLAYLNPLTRKLVEVIE